MLERNVLSAHDELDYNFREISPPLPPYGANCLAPILKNVCRQTPHPPGDKKLLNAQGYMHKPLNFREFSGSHSLC